ncbi:tryptophanase [Hyalangium versicolor]|uniref:tryptophanase n=1 Tax=Hyalangium versicolor TaxID=2861190 RepID=UPI001CCD4FD4|nr:tryptophanase [Hyalangium versicolor]
MSTIKDDPGFELETLAEPYRIKAVEKIRLLSRAEREKVLKDAFYSTVYINSEDVYIDLVTDSGTGAMSDNQWAALMKGDEAYMRARSFFEFEKVVQEVLGFQYVVPTHQGRAAEHILMGLLVKQDELVLSNTHFDTTREHVRHRGAKPIDLVGDVLWDIDKEHPFKGNFDLARLETALERYHERVPFVLITVLNNFAYSSPVSMENIREVKRLAKKWNKPVYFDACRFAENAYFIKTREPGYSDKSIGDIVKEMFEGAEGCWMSAKKDAITNIGGFLALKDEALTRRCQERLALFEGFPTYGGLAGRDLEAIAVGLREVLDESYLRHRTDQVAFLAKLFKDEGIKVSLPAGGSGVFVDVASLYGHIPPDAFPTIAMLCDLYLEGGIRAGAFPFHFNIVDAKTGELGTKVFQFARFAIPRRVYTKSHFEYIAKVMGQVKRNAAPKNKGYKCTYAPPVLAHFFSKFEPLG